MQPQLVNAAQPGRKPLQGSTTFPFVSDYFDIAHHRRDFLA
jgi:hypothetical protein